MTATPYSVAALERLKKDIIKAAIKWTLYDEPVKWDGDADSGFHGASWEGTLPPYGGPTGTVRLKYYQPGLGFAAGTPPGAEPVGEGTDAAGQPYYEYEIDPWTSIYEPWQERIESAFRGWDGIPEAHDFNDALGSIRSAVETLTPIPQGGASGGDAAGSMDSTWSAVDLAAGLGTLGRYIGPDAASGYTGALMIAFDFNYGPDRIRAVMTNQAQVAIALGSVVLGGQKVWEGAGLDIMAIAEAAAASFRPGGGGGDAIDLKVVKAFGELLSNFMPAPVKTALDAGTAVLSFVEEVMPADTQGEAAVTLEGSTPDEVYQSLVDVIAKLEQRVFDQEYELAYTTMQKTIDYMHGHDASQFHLHPRDGIDPQLAGATPLDIHPEHLRVIGYQVVPTIASFLGKAAEHAQAANQPGMWARTASIGLGSSGPHAKWAEAQGLFDQVTTGSGRELVEAGRLLAVGAGWIEDADGSSQAALHEVQDDLDRGSLGWDNSVPEVHTGPSWGGRPV